MRPAGFIAGIAILFAMTATAQSPGISGFVRDLSGSVLLDADVRIQNEDTGARWKTRTGDTGRYSVEGLPPGKYKVTARVPGFHTVSRVGAVLDSTQGLSLDFAMELLGVHEVVTVVSDRDDAADPSSSDSLLVERGSPGATLPANGSDYRMLFDLVPGVVVTPAGVSDGGQFSSNGQRPNANGFRVDGVSANGGLGGSTLPGSFPGVSLPAMSSIGSTETLGSPETSQSVEMRSSNFAPESGGHTGSETLITSRSGSNSFHAEFFAHLRDNSWNARDWFANSEGLSWYPRPSYENLGLTVGGPIWRNRTFFFFSAEASKLYDPSPELVPVPTLAARASAAPALQQLLNWFPYPIGPDQGGGIAAGILGTSTTGGVVHSSLRIDQSLGSHSSLFFRYVESPSKATSSEYGTAIGSFDWRSATLGLTSAGSRTVEDLRITYSHAALTASSEGNDVFPILTAGLLPGGNAEIPSPFPSSPPDSQVIVGLSIPDIGQFVSFDFGTALQSQWEVRNTISRQVGAHLFRLGIDAARLDQSRENPIETILGAASSLQSLLDGDPLAVTYAQPAQNGGRIYTGSLFAQDTFHVSETLSLIYGIRWEITPPTAAQVRIPTVSGLWTGTAWQTTYTGEINGTAPWPMDYRQFAPRIGLAWRLPWYGLVLRSGAGAFYDASLGASIDPINGAPFNSWLFGAGGDGIASSTGSSGTAPASPSGGVSPDVQQFLAGVMPPLRLPVSWQWRTSLERSFESRGLFSAAYAGAVGMHLLGNEAYVDPATGILERFTTLTQNSSNYQSLQLRYTGSPLPNLYASVSYSWSHSLDDGSEDSSVFLIHPGYQLSEAWASSDFDVRHSMTAALSYRVQPSLVPRSVRDGLGGWTVGGILRARTGFPIDVLNVEQALGEQFDNAGRPDLVSGQPAWIADPSVAGGRRLNPAAFSVPPAGETGTLGRNAIYGNGMIQLDASLRRDFALFRGLALEVGVSVYNVFNHPAFADPVPYLSSPWFGQSTSMQNQMLGSGTPNTGLPPLFQTGGSRSAEFNFRFSF